MLKNWLKHERNRNTWSTFTTHLVHTRTQCTIATLQNFMRRWSAGIEQIWSGHESEINASSRASSLVSLKVYYVLYSSVQEQ